MVTVGAGLIWDEVYAALDPLGVGVVGGRVTGVRNYLLTFTRPEADSFANLGWCRRIPSWWR